MFSRRSTQSGVGFRRSTIRSPLTLSPEEAAIIKTHLAEHEALAMELPKPPTLPPGGFISPHRSRRLAPSESQPTESNVRIRDLSDWHPLMAAPPSELTDY